MIESKFIKDHIKFCDKSVFFGVLCLLLCRGAVKQEAETIKTYLSPIFIRILMELNANLRQCSLISTKPSAPLSPPRVFTLAWPLFQGSYITGLEWSRNSFHNNFCKSYKSYKSCKSYNIWFVYWFPNICIGRAETRGGLVDNFGGGLRLASHGTVCNSNLRIDYLHIVE